MHPRAIKVACSIPRGPETPRRPSKPPLQKKKKNTKDKKKRLKKYIYSDKHQKIKDLKNIYIFREKN